MNPVYVVCISTIAVLLVLLWVVVRR